MTRPPRLTEEQLVQALRDLGAVSSETAVTTRKVAEHLGRRTASVREWLADTQWQRPARGWGVWSHRTDGPIGCRSNGGPNYWWAKELSR